MQSKSDKSPHVIKTTSEIIKKKIQEQGSQGSETHEMDTVISNILVNQNELQKQLVVTFQNISRLQLIITACLTVIFVIVCSHQRGH